MLGRNATVGKRKILPYSQKRFTELTETDQKPYNNVSIIHHIRRKKQ